MTNKMPGPEFSYIDILDEQINSQQAKDIEDAKAGKSKFGFPLRPSAAGECERALAYKLMEYSGQAYYEKEPMSPATVRLLGLGHSIESHIIWFLKQCELFQVKYLQQTLGFFEIDTPHEKIKIDLLEGSNDFCFISKEHGWKAVVDCKSKGDRFSHTHKSKWDEDNEKYSSMKTLTKIGESAYYADDLEAFLEELHDPFFAANFLQLNLYANSTFMLERGIDHGVILQYLKNDSRLREIRFRPSAKLYKEVETKFKAAALAAANGKPEEANQTFLAGSSKCSFCDYAKVCRSDVNTKKAFFSTLPNKRWPANISKLAHEQELLDMLQEYDINYDKEKEIKILEEKIAKRMLELKHYKIQLANGHIYECRSWKTTTSVKRSKL